MIIQLSQWIYPWLGEISMAIMATLLVIYGDAINRMVKRRIIGLHFLLRTLIFILLCAFGYGALLIYVTPMISKLLASLGMIYLGPLVVALFIALGTMAEKKNRI
ncbi:MAG: DUF3392 domain-containing protein [gamma proteobacterium symbiont of Bathyaustriella thionipta]|nr:DUF3392 domain-containing protein [gamma proteobacterium symbiont of Bathyaustriella thionipta]MCU7950157.1 DUF3392 domain-containing protein [gamma proteobacterium symbiont of Bathyaustriella thionipta]MCU7953767.1 DUF3392 domain-containing protein [gamma proteobacterium symbiont of Bathyaustriella thionipta]MCU7958240.1 DUF3392 domain-containing protein [gamma proteobacterium symbiont of Bathyaustriella thionipta]MCU7967482.1 DUF3392 domain-containing protein [gamma proteobacterium symbion